MMQPLTFLLMALLPTVIQAAATTLMVHGSGTTNPEKCFGSIIENFVARAKMPIRMTYRSIGSSTGLTEFVNNFETPIVDFASGEIPLSSEHWQEFKDQNITVLHLPALFGAVSFFHSVPVSGSTGMNLTSCLLARIFTRDIKDWAHPDILAESPNLDLQSLEKQNGNTNIIVARRVLGSGNTLAITEYLNKACPEHFPAEMVSSLPEWPADTKACQGNGGLLKCIEDVPGTIGYLEAGSGIDAGLPEVSLKNKYGRTLNSQQAAAFNGIGAKEQGVLPADPADDFGQVSLMDQNGEFTWPITLLTYIYVRMDLSHMPDPQEQSLLVAFLKALYEPEFNAVCAERYGFTLAEGIAYDLAQKAISKMEAALPADAQPWIFETKPEAYVGQGDYVISSTRLSLPQDERDFNLQAYKDLQVQHDLLKAQVELLMATQAGLAEDVANHESEFTESDQAQITAALALGSIGLCFALMALAIPFVKDDAKSG